MRTIAILCGGGPAPGINTVVATVTKVFFERRIPGFGYPRRV